MGRWSNRGGQRHCRRGRLCPQQEECEAGTLDLDSRDGRSYRRRLRRSHRSERRRNPPLAHRWKSAGKVAHDKQEAHIAGLGGMNRQALGVRATLLLESGGAPSEGP